MSVLFRLGDRDGNAIEVKKNLDRNQGVTAYTTPYIEADPKNIPFLNPTFGSALNQAITFSGTPEGIHDGTDSVLWTATAISGTWTFDSTTNPQAGTKCVDATATVNNDAALFSDATTTNMANFTAITGQIRLEGFDSTRGNHVEMQFRLAGTPVGNSVNIDNFIDDTLFDVYQGFVVPKALLGLTTQTVDEMVITTLRDTGPAPDYRLDAMQIEQTGTPALFIAAPLPGTVFRIEEIVIVLVDALASTLADATMPNLAYNTLLGVSALTNGIVFLRVRNRKVAFAGNIKQLSDFVLFGLVPQAFSDGTNTTLVLRNQLPVPILMDARVNDSISLTVSDDLSGLVLFRALVRGSEEVL